MNATESTPNAIDLLAEEFVERFRRGERPAVSEYEARFPEQAEAIRDLFPALVIMENLKPHSAPVPTTGQAECASEVASLGKLGDYRIVREVGRGGMGIVYEAVQESLGRQVALKVRPKQLLGDPSRQSRFDREARAAARLHHTNIVPVFGVGEESGLHYYAMQYIHGLGLDEVLRELKRLRSPSQEEAAATEHALVPAAEEPRRHAVSVTVTQALLTGQFDAGGPEDLDNPTAAAAPTRPASVNPRISDTVNGRHSDTARLSGSFTLPGLQEAGPGTGRNTKTLWQSIARIGTQVGAALHYAHEQAVLHRDIKPSNLLLDTRGTVWVTDFGLAKADDQRDLTNTGDVLGTLRYMAPEMFSGQADRRSDVYSLGLTLYELLALRPAFDEADRGRLIRLVLHESPPRLRTLDPAIPRDLETIIHKAIDREASHRYPSAQELADDLQRFLDDEPIRARRISPLTRFNRWCKRNPAVAGLTSAIAILLLAATGVSLAAAMTFQQMASRNSKLAGDLKAALGDAGKNLALARQQETVAKLNADLANERSRIATSNLQLAIKALDTVFLDFIANKRAMKSILGDEQSPALSSSEKELLEAGLSFYQRLISTNTDSDDALFAAGSAQNRTGMLEAALAKHSAARKHFQLAAENLEKLIGRSSKVGVYHHELGRAYLNLAMNSDWPKREKELLKKADHSLSQAIQLGVETGALYVERAMARDWIGNDRGWFADSVRSIELDSKDAHRSAAFAIRLHLITAGNPAFNRDELDALAIQHARKAVELEPKYATFQAILARCLLDSPKHGATEALEAANAAVALDPVSSHALLHRTIVFRRLGELDKALADVNKAIELEPTGWSYRRRAGVFMAMKRYDEALADFERVPESDRRVSYYYWEERGELHMLRGEHEEAIRHLTNALELKPFSWHVYKRRAGCYFTVARFPEALGDLQKARELNPIDLSTLTWISPSLVAKCPNDEFRLELVKLADEAVVKNPAARSHRAVIAMHLGKWDKARQDMAELMKVGSIHYSSHYNLAMLSLADKNQEQYRSACRDMLAKFAESKIAEELNFTVWTAALAPQALDDYGPAIALAQRGMELNKENPEAIRSLGAILYRAGKFDEAAKQLAPLAATAEKSSPEAKTSSAYPLFFLAMAQHQLGKKDEARATLQKAADLAKAELSDDKNPPVWNRKLTLELLQKEAVGLIGN
ncbi:MAG TPA: protein kinase [Pirellulaceae bacterium]|nr:protein kinase [Pirellulaceae bacterium]